MKRNKKEDEPGTSEDHPFKISNPQDFVKMLDFMIKKLGGKIEEAKGKLVKSIPAKKEWIEKRDDFIKRKKEISKMKDRLHTEQDIFWHQVELELDWYDNMSFSKDGKEMELFSSEE